MKCVLRVCLQCAYNFETSGYEKSRKLLTYRTLTFGVPGRTRTVDIQNHKHLHGFSAIPFVHRCFRGLRKPCLRLFCGYLYFELKFAKSFPFLILHFITAICKQILLDLIAFFKAFFESFFKLSFAALFQFQQ